MSGCCADEVSLARGSQRDDGRTSGVGPDGVSCLARVVVWLPYFGYHMVRRVLEGCSTEKVLLIEHDRAYIGI